MIDAPQITVQGIDKRTKRILEKQAKARGMSLNKYFVDMARRAAGTDTAEERFCKLKAFFDGLPKMSAEDSKAFDEAIAWSDRVTREKRQREDEKFGL